MEINVSFRGSTIKLAKTKAITYLLTYATAFSGRHFMSATKELANLNVFYYKKKNPVELFAKTNC